MGKVLTVSIAAYNVEKFIAKTLVFGQKLTFFKIDQTLIKASKIHSFFGNIVRTETIGFKKSVIISINRSRSD